jgi:hypothetical protein
VLVQKLRSFFLLSSSPHNFFEQHDFHEQIDHLLGESLLAALVSASAGEQLCVAEFEVSVVEEEVGEDVTVATEEVVVGEDEASAEVQNSL